MGINIETTPYIKASADAADPVGRHGADWGFWDETWSNWNGGFTNEAEARAALEEYAAHL